jgi:tetratricopeptide (TPR) repeat protein
VKIGRNDPCPCGSQKKYKNCHGATAAAAAPARPQQKSAPRRPSRPEAIAAAARLNQLARMMNSGQFAEAEAIARTLLNSYPNHGQLWKALGTSLALQGKDAIRELQRACQLLPADAEAFYYFGNALNDRG